MIYTFIARTCTDLPVTACCRVMGVSTSGFYSWQAEPVRAKDLDDAYLCNTIVDIWTMSRRSYGSPRVHAELKLGQDVRCSRKRVERLMRQAQIAGIHRRRRGGCTRRDLGAEPSDDLVKRFFDPTEPDRLWVMDVTEHPTGDGKAYLAVVLDAFFRASWAGRSPITCARARGRRPPDGHLAPSATPRGRPLPIPTTGRCTPRGLSEGAYAVRPVAPWDQSAIASTTLWPRASSARSSSSCSTSITGRAASNSPKQSSNGSKPGTTRDDATATARC